jgi:uncharacterized ion transporter superfamily protein YfcC
MRSSTESVIKSVPRLQEAVEKTPRHETKLAPSIKIPHVFIFLFYIILFCAILTYIVPSGSFERTTRKYGEITQNVVVPGSFKYIPKHYSLNGLLMNEPTEGKAAPISLFSLLMAIPKGLNQSAVLIFFVFTIGGVFNIVHHTGGIKSLVVTLIARFRTYPKWLIFIIYMVLFSGSSLMGIDGEPMVLIPIFLMLAKELGYDRIFAIALIIIPVGVGWSTGVTNPFTVQIAQQIAELPPGSGIGLRLLLFLVCSLTGFIFLMRYGKRVKEDPATSFMKNDPFELQDNFSGEYQKLNKKQGFVLLVALLCYAAILAAVQTIGWGLLEMTAGFMGIGILVILIYGISGDEAMKALAGGLKLMLVPALAVGVARGVSVVLHEGQIMDTILYHASEQLSSLPRIAAGEGMLILQTMLNFFIPSASGQALVAMPIMTPMSDLLGLTRQTAVLAFMLGDGLSNIVIPTNGTLMAMLFLAGVPFEKWLRFVFPLFIICMLIAALFIMVAIAIDY